MIAKRKSLYIETTIPSYITGRTSRDVIIAGRQMATRLFWDTERYKYDLFISQYVMEEIVSGDATAAAERIKCVADIPTIPESPEIEELAAVYKKLLQIPERANMDCNHAATCVIEHIDYLMTWNCAHLGPITQVKLQDYNIKHGLWLPTLVTPEALMYTNIDKENTL
jgi:hypothetical protein